MMASDNSIGPTPRVNNTAEGRRLEEIRAGVPWRRWGPYLSERQWGTVREDYSADGDAWEYLPHDHSRSRAYRWGEDGLGGFGDDHLNLCLGVALWNEHDPILKERLFGLTNSEGNHGEDVKELYHYVDGVPEPRLYADALSLSAERIPLPAPRRRKCQAHRARSGIRTDRHRHLRWAALFRCRDRIRQGRHRRHPDAADRPQPRPRGRAAAPDPAAMGAQHLVVGAEHRETAPRGRRRRRRSPPNTIFCSRCGWSATGSPELLFCDNESNALRLWGHERVGYPKDSINDYIVGGHDAAVNPARVGTKVAAHYRFTVPAGGQVSVRVRLTANGAGLDDFDAVMQQRRAETDEFYAALQSGIDDAEARLVQRHAFAGMLWSKQYYHLDIRQWLRGDPLGPKPPPSRLEGRNIDWLHLYNSDVISMPDKWEYPWYAAWDLAFHCVVLAQVDPDFAKDQLILLTREWYMHPNAQLPAFEWEFGDVNPPVHAWAAWRVYEIDREARGGKGDVRVPRTRLPQADAEFHLVGEPQGRRRAQHFPGRVSRSRQHPHFRPQPAPADRRPDQPGRRHRLDGDVHAEPDARGPRTGRGRPRLRRYRDQVLRAFPADRRGDEPYRRSRNSGCGTKPTSSITTCCRRREARRCRCGCARSSG